MSLDNHHKDDQIMLLDAYLEELLNLACRSMAIESEEYDKDHLLVFAILESNKLYDTPVEALFTAYDLMLEYAELLGHKYRLKSYLWLFHEIYEQDRDYQKSKSK